MIVPTAYGSLGDESSFTEHYDYNYPGDRKFRPGSELHNKIVEKVIGFANRSASYMSGRYDEWRTIDTTLRSYQWTKDRYRHSQKTKSSPLYGEKGPIVVMPVSHASLETMLTYVSASFLQEPIFRYEGVGPEDAEGAIRLTMIVNKYMQNSRAGLALHTSWRDGLAYGLGVMAPRWVEKRRSGIVRRPVEREIPGLGVVPIANAGERLDRALVYEGVELNNIDPYRFLPDPTVSAHDIQSGEFHGWVSQENTLNVLSTEQADPEHFFNGKYVRGLARSSFFSLGRESDLSSWEPDKLYSYQTDAKRTDLIDILWMYVNLIPAEWDLGSGEYPEKWLFAVAGGKVLLCAHPVDTFNGDFALAVCAPDFDGYSIAPQSRLGFVNDLQNIIDFLYTSHIQNIRKVLNDMFVVDPAVINIFDLDSPEPGKIIRMRRSVWGTGNIDQAIKQLNVQDVTSGHINEMGFLMSMIDKFTGSTEAMSGQIGRRGPRVSAAEYSGARGAGVSRMEKMAKIISMQFMQPLANLIAGLTQDNISQETYARLVGNSTVLGQGVDGSGRVKINREDLNILYDVAAFDSSIPGSQDVETWMGLLNFVQADPALLQQMDMPKIVKHLARQMGVAHPDEFFKNPAMMQQEMSQPGMPPQVMPDDQVMQNVQQGNLVPLGSEIDPSYQ